MTNDATGTPLGDLLAKVEERAWPSDRAYFEARPQLCFRIRPAWLVEIPSNVAANTGKVITADEVPLPPPGECWWMLVRQIQPGVRLRFPFPAPHSMDPDPAEKICKRVWREICDCIPEMRKLEKSFEEK